VEEYRSSIDANPGLFLEARNQVLEGAVRRAAARYLGVNADDVALTDSTTMGIALVYNGLAVRNGQELLTTTHD
jgi:isopenicillin-N epimerase